jgi:ADP-ribose pyrophosphatase YjhB (NUDIX family)
VAGDLRLRRAARAVVLDPDDRVLLVRFEFPARAVWAAPGGGLDGEETHAQAIVRELAEEVGLAEPVLGPVVWERTHVVPFIGGRWDGQVERFFLVRTPRFEPAPRLSWEELRREYVTAMRWWTVEEIRTSQETFAPRRMAELLAALLRDGPPATPVDAGV